jgi:hypothetical protein
MKRAVPQFGAVAGAAGLGYSFHVVGALVSVVMVGIAIYLWRNPEIAKAGED